jgi:hypothetical protein
MLIIISLFYKINKSACALRKTHIAIIIPVAVWLGQLRNVRAQKTELIVARYLANIVLRKGSDKFPSTKPLYILQYRRMLFEMQWIMNSLSWLCILYGHIYGNSPHYLAIGDSSYGLNFDQDKKNEIQHHG